MENPKVIIVTLRQPRQNDSRTDPLWEFGSFGCTGCHTRNLMNPRKAHLLDQARLAFAQGGHQGFKLVYLAPPIETVLHSKIDGEIVEAKWLSISMPFKYAEAPLLVDNNGDTDFPLLRHYIETVKRSTPVAKFTSKFRSRREPLEMDIAQELIEVFDQAVSLGKPERFASIYIEALPYLPDIVDNNRDETYWKLIKKQTIR